MSNPPRAMNDARIFDLPDRTVEVQLLAAKRAYTTRRAPDTAICGVSNSPSLRPRRGDLVLAKIDRLGKHRHIELVSGRRSALFVHDEIIVAYADRYAPDQFEAYVPDDLSPCHLAAGGGIAARVVSRHDSIGAPTAITPIGLLTGKDGEVLNVSRFGFLHQRVPSERPPVIACLGTSMNAGKTTSAAYLIRGLSRAGLRVGAAKVTGTGSGNDPWLMRDAGAQMVVDFTDAGHASTFQLATDRVVAVAETLVAQLATHAMDVVVLEVADGLLQNETASLFRSASFADIVDGVVFAAADSMGAIVGSDWLRDAGLEVIAVCGTFTRSPLAVREAGGGMRVPVLTLEQLADPASAAELHALAKRSLMGAVA